MEVSISTNPRKPIHWIRQFSVKLHKSKLRWLKENLKILLHLLLLSKVAKYSNLMGEKMSWRTQYSLKKPDGLWLKGMMP
jgi:hypothetical protein